MKNIVILSAFLSPFRSGAEACAEEVPLALCDQYDFTIVTARLKRSLPKNDLLQGKIPVVRVGLGLGFDKWLFPFLAPLAVRKLKPDITHAVLETFAGLALKFCPGKKILTCQTTNRSFMKGSIVKKPDHVTAISKALVKMVQKLGRQEVALIPNGIDLAGIRASRERFQRVSRHILFVGRLEKMKGVDTLIRAMKGLDATLHIVGDGSQKEHLKHLAHQLGLEHIVFRGHLIEEDLYREYAEAEIFCGLSRSEALGNVFLEAQAAGCAVIGTRVGGIPDIIMDGESGLLVEPDDVEEARAALQRLLDDQELRNRVTGNGMRNAEKYDWKAIAERYEEVYSQVHG